MSAARRARREHRAFVFGMLVGVGIALVCILAQAWSSLPAFVPLYLLSAGFVAAVGGGAVAVALLVDPTHGGHR